MPGVQHGGVPSARYLAMGGGSPLTEEWYFADARYTWDQLAAFGEMSYRFTDQFTATGQKRSFGDRTFVPLDFHAWDPDPVLLPRDRLGKDIGICNGHAVV